MYQIIRQQIIDVLNSSDVSRIKKAFRTQSADLTEFPVALVFPTESDAEFSQTSPESNRETYSFTIRVIYPFTEGQDKADIELEQAVDQVIETFRDRNRIPFADWVQPVPSRWGYVDRANGTNRVADITIRCVKYVNT